MKKLITFMVLIVGANLAIAQQKYYAFSINGKHGITDNIGTEAIKPIYKYSTLLEAKSQIYLQDFSERPDLIFNAKTGVKQFYQSVFMDQVNIKGVPYSLIVNKGKRFLLSEETSKTINLVTEYSDFKNVGQYIIAKFYPKSAPTKSGGVDKNGIPMPPKLLPPPKENFAVLTNDETLKPLIKGDFKTYLLLNKVEDERNQEGLQKVEIVNLVDRSEQSFKFDYILFSKGNSHNLYNSKMVLVKTFISAKANEDMLVNAAKNIVKHNLVSLYGEGGGAPMIMGPPSVASMPGSNEVEEQKEEKKPFKPFFYVKELANGNTLFALQETEEISKHIFEAKKGVEVNLDKEDLTIRIEIEDKEDSEFSFDPKTGAIYLPKAYFAQLGLTII